MNWCWWRHLYAGSLHKCWTLNRVSLRYNHLTHLSHTTRHLLLSGTLLSLLQVKLLIMVQILLQSLIGLPEYLNGLLLLLILLSHHLSLVVQVLNLVLQDLHIVVTGSLIVLQLSLHTLLSALLYCQLLKFLSELLNLRLESLVLIFEQLAWLWGGFGWVNYYAGVLHVRSKRPLTIV